MHIPVLQKEVLEYLDPKPDQNFIDCTVGEGGHAAVILEKNKPGGKVLGIEVDSDLYQNLKSRMAEIPNSKIFTRQNFWKKFRRASIPNRLVLVNDSYSNLKEVVEKERFGPVSGILFDLGFSSWHLEESGRGFSFLKNEPLDMRYDKNSKLTAEQIINRWSEKELEEILKEYGEERFARNIARKIIEKRKTGPIGNTFQLVEIVRSATPGWYHRRKIHPATKTFQALRIVVNDELNNLKKGLEQGREVLNPGARMVAISFHSLEDRIVKNFFKAGTKEGSFNLLTKKPVRPRFEEVKINPRARSARLRAAKLLKHEA